MERELNVLLDPIRREFESEENLKLIECAYPKQMMATISGRLSICMHVCLSVCVFCFHVCLFICVFKHLFVCRVQRQLCLCVCLCASQSVYMCRCMLLFIVSCRCLLRYLNNIQVFFGIYFLFFVRIQLIFFDIFPYHF